MRDRKNNGCSNPDCIPCTAARGERPASPIMQEFAGVYDQMLAAVEAEAEQDMTFTVSGASVIFLAFLDRLAEAHGQVGVRVRAGVIDLADPVEQARAGRFLANLIPALLEDHLQSMLAGEHPMLAAADEAAGVTVH